MKIITVIVTHNRSQLLSRCIDSLKSQSYLPDEILVVNNGSTDDTSEVIKYHNVSELKQDNLGSAGGWSAGIEYCIKYNFDACWLMDDDGFPEKEALKILKDNLNDLDACVSSCVLDENDKTSFVFPIPKLNSAKNPVLFSTKRKYYSISELSNLGNHDYDFAHLFNGALIKSDSIKKIGNVNKNYFIMGDEVDYFYRLRTAGNVRTILSAKHFHPDVTKRKYSDIKIYYLIKNTIINHNKYFDMNYIRNICLVMIVFIRVLKRNGVLYFFKFLFNKNFPLFKAIYSGAKGRVGIDLKILG